MSWLEALLLAVIVPYLALLVWRDVSRALTDAIRLTVQTLDELRKALENR